jgi:quercetin dioxygenase-like cupin family protein
LAQKIEKKESIFAVNANRVPIEDLAKKGADRVQVRYLIDERHGSNRFALRLYTMQKGGHTPLDQHEYEHHVYVLGGRGLLRETKQNSLGKREIREGDAIFIPSNAVHQFINERDEPLVFLCVKGNPSLYSASSQGQVHTVAHQDSAGNFC